MAESKITLKHSIIGHPQNQHDTAKALDLAKISSSVVKPSNGTIKDMINTISHLVDVEKI